VPPTIVVTTTYPGASAQTVADTVATPIEQEVNGVEHMLYMYSQATSDGGLTLTITFKPGTDLDKAQVLVQNRIATATARLPEPVQHNGVQTKKSSPTNTHCCSSQAARILRPTAVGVSRVVVNSGWRHRRKNVAFDAVPCAKVPTSSEGGPAKWLKNNTQ
jgi:multidrug efflux pump subunit AcrB